MRTLLSILTLGVALMCMSSVQAEVYNIIDFGAVGDGVTMNTIAIQKAIDTAHADGGGMVEVPHGTFLSGSIFLKSYVTLHLAQNAVLKASEKPEDYTPVDFCPQNRAFAGDFVKGSHFIIAVEQKNVKICGEGTINGSGEHFLKDPESNRLLPKQKVPWRPGQMVFFCECENVTVEDVLLTNSPYWTSFFHGCVGVRIDGVRIRNRRDAANADGIDIDCCRNVRISNCDIDTCDDCITLRASTEPLKVKRPCENVVVTNCILSSACQAVRVGVGDGLIRNAVFSNLVIHNTNVGLNFHSSYSPMSLGTTIKNIRFQNITMDTETAFHMTYGHAASDRTISDVYFCDISGTARRTSFLLGKPGQTLKNIHFRDVILEMDGEQVKVENVENLDVQNCSFINMN
ncbi:MAG: glycosyl hydrolase family 28 protein [Planctomycetia bacterium]|nr:glycosyl hydrolase family 28 protein [Planctomycetia bacterium]